MSTYETITAYITIFGWIIALLAQLLVLYQQSQLQKNTTELQNSLGARREIASTKLEYLSLMTKWLDKGLGIQRRVMPIYLFLTDTDDEPWSYEDPKPNISEIVTNLSQWSTEAEHLIMLAQIYDPKVDPQKPLWKDEFINNLPEDLPRLLGAFDSIMHSFVWDLINKYQELGVGYPRQPDENEFIPLPNAKTYIIPIYLKAQIALERTKEFVVTQPLTPKIHLK